MSHEVRRKVILVVVALVVIALVLGSTGCSSTTGDGGDDDGTALTPALYTQAMSDICTTTTERLATLPVPPDEISRADWAGEVSRALRDEAAAFDRIEVGDERRTDHASIVANTEDQAEQWMALSVALAPGAATDTGDASIADLTTEITELTLGRNDLADEMGLVGCRARELS